MKEYYYKVAEHVFSLDMGTKGDLVCDLRQYESFVTDPTEDVVFSMQIVDMPFSTEGFQDEMHQEEEGQRNYCWTSANGRTLLRVFAE